MGKSANIESLLEKILSIAFFLYLINNFDKLAFIFLNSIIKVSSSVGGNFDPKFFTNPSAILEYASTGILQPLGALVDKSQPKGFLEFPDLKLILMFGLSWICVMICFVIVALQICFATIEFHIIVLMSLVIIPFNVLEQTRFIGTKVFPAVAGQAIKVGVASLIAGVGISVFRSQFILITIDKINIHFIVVLIGSSILLAFLSLQIPALASGMLSGTPNLSLSGFMQNLSGSARMMSSGFNAAKSVNSGIDKLNNKVDKAWDNKNRPEIADALNKQFKR